VPGWIAVEGFLRTGLVLHFPSAILAVGLVLTGVLLAFTGLVLHAVARRFQEHDRVMRGLLEAVERREHDDR